MVSNQEDTIAFEKSGRHYTKLGIEELNKQTTEGASSFRPKSNSACCSVSAQWELVTQHHIYQHCVS